VTVAEPFTRTGAALREAGRDARLAWGPGAWLVLAALVLAALVPFVLPSSVRLDGLAQTGYLALAAVGLGFAVGVGGMPSLAQGAFVGVGAVAAGHLVGWGAPPLVAAGLGGLAAACGGVLTGAAVVRFRPVVVVAATWLATWLFTFSLDAFRALTGGARGLTVAPEQIAGLEPTATLHYELALGLVALSVLGYRTLARSSFGVRLRAAGQRPAAAVALGVRPARLRLAAFAGAAAVGGLAGGLSVQLDGVVDPEGYDAFLSFTLLVAVLIGGAATALGPVAGVAAVGALSLAADALARLTGAESARFGPMLAALLLVSVLATGSDGIVPAVTRRVRRAGRRRHARTSPPTPPGQATLTAQALEKRFGDLVAVRGVDIELRSSRVAALIGPNGSGKTTVLRLLAGTLPPDGGRVALDARALADTPADERVELGLVRTLQANAVFPDLSALENTFVGASLRRRYGGALRALFGTPKARAEAREAQARALAALAAVGLEEHADVLARTLPGSEQRLLMIASALATEPRILLLDEPSAGASSAELQRLAEILERLRAEGFAVLAVEHNLRLVRRIADEVVVLSAGAPLASGTPEDVAGNPAVRAAYLGRQNL
jgi:ABC-type branched-subunit amino acid transport system ATPase component/ABC-type branched-subunit amino acid transport system permease subunit